MKTVVEEAIFFPGLFFIPFPHFCSFMDGWGWRLGSGFRVGVYNWWGLGPVVWGLLGFLGLGLSILTHHKNKPAKKLWVGRYLHWQFDMILPAQTINNIAISTSMSWCNGWVYNFTILTVVDFRILIPNMVFNLYINIIGYSQYILIWPFRHIKFLHTGTNINNICCNINNVFNTLIKYD